MKVYYFYQKKKEEEELLFKKDLAEVMEESVTELLEEVITVNANKNSKILSIS